MGRVKSNRQEIEDYLGRISLHAVAAGKVPGHQLVNVLGRNKDVDSGNEDLWNGQGDYTGFNAVAEETLEVFSATAADKGKPIHITGLNFAGEQVEEIILLDADDATTPVIGSVPFWRAAKAHNDGGVDLVGDITIRQSTTIVNIMCVMPNEANQTTICATTIPNGKIGVLVQVTGRMIKGGSATAEIDVFTRRSGKVFLSTLPAVITQGTPFDKNVVPLRILEAREDIKMRCLVVSTSNIDILGTMDILLIDEDLF